MEVRAIAKYVRVQPRKVRIIADEVRGKSAVHTASLLRYHTSKSAQALHQVLISAMANAQENHNLSPDQLKIAAITVDEGPRLKRMQARAMGRGNRIVKKTSHITVVVEDYEAPKAVKPHGSKPKPRPTFAAPTKGKKKSAAQPVAADDPVVEATDVVAAPVEASEPISTTETAEQAPTTESTEGGTAPTDEKGAE
ncbi:MAG: 50S ribosomal protein L22 [Fimbriimonas sp.]|nr:50S ribosomal protein L22 [Fimbriimonas sp.]